MDLWFGDSYAVGAELAEHYGKYVLNSSNHRFVRPDRDRPELAFPHLISTYFNNDYINFGKGGSSIEFQLVEFTLYIKREMPKDVPHTAFFCLPNFTRRFAINDTHCHWVHDRKWYGYNKDLEVIDYHTSVALNHIYLLATNYNIKPYFLSLYYDIETWKSFDIVPEENWLLSSSTNLVREAWGITNPPETWRTKKGIADENYKKYIYPCGNHPNILGHTVMADFIIQKLNERNS